MSKLVVLSALIATFATSSRVDFDPPVNPPPGCIIPPGIFCFRFTDIVQTGPSRFQFEVEFLNWTGQIAYGLHICRTQPPLPPRIGGQPKIAGASVDANGRPLGVGNDDWNFPPADGTGMPAKVGKTNFFQATDSNDDLALFEDPTTNGIPARDLFRAWATGGNAAVWALIPGCDTSGVIANVETVDNALDESPQGPFDNVLDGFVLDISDFDVGEMISLNWWLLDRNGDPIGMVNPTNPGNQFGYGVINIYRGINGPGVWQRVRGAVPGANVGTSSDLRDMVPKQVRGSQEDFEVELAAASTAPGPVGCFPPGAGVNMELMECWLLVGFRAANIPITPNATLLLEPLTSLTMTLSNFPAIPIPDNTDLVGLRVYLQGAAWNPWWREPLRLSNRVDAQIGVGTTSFGAGNGMQIWSDPGIPQIGGQLRVGFSLR